MKHLRPYLVLAGLGVILTLAGTGARAQSGEVRYHAVAPKIHVPFDPARVETVVRKQDLFAVKISPGSSDSRVSDYGDRFWHLMSADYFSTYPLWLRPRTMVPVPLSLEGFEREALRMGALGNDTELRRIAIVVANRRGVGDAVVLGERFAGAASEHIPWRLLHRAQTSIAKPVVTPDGAWVGFRSTGRLWVQAADGKQPPQALLDGVSDLAAGTQAFFAVRHEHEIWRLPFVPRPSASSAQRLLQLPHESIEDIDVDRAETRLAYVARASGKSAVLRVVSLPGLETIWEVKGVTKSGVRWFSVGVRRMRLSGDGRRLLYSGVYEGREGLFWVALDPPAPRVRDLTAELGYSGGSLDLNGTGEIAIVSGSNWDTLIFLEDETAPRLALVFPVQGLWLEDEPLELVVGYRDRAFVSGVDPRTLQAWLDGEELRAFEAGPERASAKLDSNLFAKKANRILRVRVADRAGNVAEEQFSLRRLAKRLEFERSGGIGGWRGRLVVYEEGHWRLEQDKDGSTQRGQFDEKGRLMLDALLHKLNAMPIERSYRPAVPLYDGYRYTLRYAGNIVELQDPLDRTSAPPVLKELVQVLSATLKR